MKLGIIKNLAEIGPLRKIQPIYRDTKGLSVEAAQRWLQGFMEGEIGGLELFINEKGVSIQLIKTKGAELEKNDIPPILSTSQDIECFQYFLKKPSIYSITQKDTTLHWLNNLEWKKGAACIQLLFQKDRGNKWKGILTQQYEDYLKGISHPSTLLPIRSIQLKLAEISKNINLSIPLISSFEKRIHQPVYRVLIRGFITGKERERNNWMNDLLTKLNQQKGENEWDIIIKKRINIDQIEKWKTIQFPYLSSLHPFIVENELALLLPCTATAGQTKVIPKEPVKKIENLFPIFQFLPYHHMQHEPLLLDHFEQELNGSLEKLGIIKEEGIQIIDSVQGPTLLRLNFVLPKGIRLSDLQKNIADWQTELGLIDLAVYQGKEKGTGILALPRKNRQAVYLRYLVDTREFHQFSKDSILPFVIGSTETGEPLYEDLTRIKHLLVAGATGSGKSIWLLQVILLLLLWVPSEQLIMYLIDPKRVEFPGFSSFKNVKVYTEVEEAKQLLDALIKLMETRYEVLKKGGVRNIAQYNRKVKDTPMPYVVTVIDEFSDLILQNREIEEGIIRLAQKARACGIHLIIVTQRPSVDVVTGLIKANLPSRVVFKCSSRNDYSTVLDQKLPFQLLGMGDGACLMEGKGLIRFQGPLIASDEEKMDEIIETYGKNQSGTTPLSIEIDSESEEEITAGPLDELKRYIAFTGETRITYIRKHLKMRMNDVKDLMQVLVKEGWLEAPKTRNSGYKLILTGEEREMFLKEER
jgi:S-DNA-T family DNA segregation ATPase FtsK/SpoIIIE